ncbi:MAG: hypothetical protein ACI9F9_000908, partial [Candidatus Paceibacteria bacterium]
MVDHSESHPMSLHFNCRDVSAAIKFYTDVLSFEMQTCWPSE